MASSGPKTFADFAANFLRVRKIEAQIAQERVFDREASGGSLAGARGSRQTTLADVVEMSRMSGLANVSGGR